MIQRKGYSQFIEGLVVLGDFLVLNLVYFLVTFIFVDYLTESVIEDVELLQIYLNISYLPTVLISRTVLHQRIIFADKIAQKAVHTVALHFMMFVSMLLLVKMYDVSRLFLVIFFLLDFIAMAIYRLCVRYALKLYRRQGYNYSNIIIVGGGKNGMALAEELNSDQAYGFHILGFFDDNPGGLPPGVTFLGTTQEVEAFILSDDNQVDQVFCTLPESAEAKILKLVNFCENNMIRINIVPEIRRYMKKTLNLELMGSIPILVLRDEPLQNTWNRFMKRTFDLIFSFLFLVTLFLPLYLIVGIIIKLTSNGDIFFKQKRTGKSGNEFYCYKFRTMYVNTLSHTKQAVKNDPRITPIGAFLRKTNLDEMPQFINVFLGDMSVVGPRPHMLQHTEEYSKLIDKYMVRHLIKPGITGWAQVTGFRGETKTLDQMEQRVIRDVWYIENWSLMLDVKIVFRTILNMFKGEDNAY